MSEPIGNSEQLNPVAYMSIFEKDNAHDKFTFVQSKWYPTPVYAHPMRELTDEEIKQIIEKHSRSSRRELVVAIIKASRGEK
jgi:2,4-dienoyl-CoA reductase-like NADH-dependent reductase (Old Yellow Enzyme family)